ncbi:MAG: NAD(P)-binding domain-containing protein [Devosia sp.]|uniref:NADPH-dependent F420 reductase n=1 Tax=Devosia sp. TaxID=1871048 RepID=UPI001A5B6240|nr:NAD(P)-binding domain-containing protein [Devosia sp.]MBL8596799.1 NAD(P)-binding domain-containing protein [Devosia sp.]
MTIAILGQGNMGSGLARRLEGQADLALGARDPKAGELSYADAVAKADIVVLALPFDAAIEVAKSLDLAGKVVVDISNPIAPDFSGLTIGHSTSAAEEIQKAAPQAKVVKAFNTIFASLFAAPVAETRDVPVFVAGNDEAAVAQVGDLARKAGFSVENAGTLDAARLIEPVGMLNIRFGYGLGKGTAIAPVWVKLAA